MTPGSTQFTQQVYTGPDGLLHVDTTIEGIEPETDVHIPVWRDAEVWVLMPNGELARMTNLGNWATPPLLTVKEIQQTIPKAWPEGVTTVYSFTLDAGGEHQLYAMLGLNTRHDLNNDTRSHCVVVTPEGADPK